MTARDTTHDAGQLLRADLGMLMPSPTNPRKSFPLLALQELADSIKAMGVMSPIIVRPIPHRYREQAPGAELEIIAGERRWRAAAMAGLSDIPILLREDLDDAAAECLQVIENLQREDLNAIDEATGYARLRDQGMSVPQIAERIGKAPSAIYAALKLCTLVDEAKDAVRDGRLDATMATLIARIPVPSIQLEALQIVLTPDEHTGERISYRRAKALLAQKTTINLAKAVFDTADGTLLPEAGACTACPDRLGNQDECPTGSENVCTRPPCHEAKRQAHNVRLLALPDDTPRVDIPKMPGTSGPTNWTDYDAAGYRLLNSTWNADSQRRTYAAWLADNNEQVPTAIHVDPSTGNAHAIAKKSDLAAAIDRITAAYQAEAGEQQGLDVATTQPDTHSAGREDTAERAGARADAVARSQANQTRAKGDAPKAQAEHNPLQLQYAQYRAALEQAILANPPLMLAGHLLIAVAGALQGRSNYGMTESEAMQVLLSSAVKHTRTYALEGTNTDHVTLESIASLVGIDHYALINEHVPTPEGCARPNVHGVYPAQGRVSKKAQQHFAEIYYANTEGGWRAAHILSTKAGEAGGPIAGFQPAATTKEEAIALEAKALYQALEKRAGDIPGKALSELKDWAADLAKSGGVALNTESAPSAGQTLKYRHPETPALTWSGRGKKPEWVLDWIKKGGSLDALSTDKPEAA